jgi:hypothetical protein
MHAYEPRVRIEDEESVRSVAARNPETSSTRNTGTEREALRPKTITEGTARSTCDALTKRRRFVGPSVTDDVGEEGGSARPGGGCVLAPFSSMPRESTNTKICVNRLSLA